MLECRPSSASPGKEEAGADAASAETIAEECRKFYRSFQSTGCGVARAMNECVRCGRSFACGDVRVCCVLLACGEIAIVKSNMSSAKMFT